MRHNAPFLFIVVLLFAIGITGATFRHQEYGIPLLPGTQQAVWQVEARIEFVATGDSTQIAFTLPPTQPNFEIIGENTASPGYGFVIEQGPQRRAKWTARDAAGAQTLFYKLDIAETDLIDVFRGIGTDEPMPVGSNLQWDEPFRTAAQQVIASVLPRTADALSLAQQLRLEMMRDPADQNVSLLLDQYGNQRAALLAAMLNEADVVARSVYALKLEDGRRRQPLVRLVQIWVDDGWRIFDPSPVDAAETNETGPRYLLWQTSSPSVLDVIGGTRSRVSFSMLRQTRPALSIAGEGGVPLVSLYSLPIAEQSMFQLIMLLPIGALVVVFMRLVIGVKTSGTFMPVLIAMAFLQTELIPGILSFVLVISVGLVIRSYLSSLNLLLVARIAVLVILVIGIISIFSVISYRLGLIAGLTITFFPMIILAWTIERMSILWEEEGAREVLIQGSGSLFVATLAFLLMDQDLTRHLAFNFPELHAVILAFILMLGRYMGYRASELWRFATMKGSQ